MHRDLRVTGSKLCLPRCIPQTDIGWNPFMESWVQARPLESEKVVLEGEPRALWTHSATIVPTCRCMSYLYFWYSQGVG